VLLFQVSTLVESSFKYLEIDPAKTLVPIVKLLGYIEVAAFVADKAPCKVLY
jgi:hypothetical protein